MSGEPGPAGLLIGNGQQHQLAATFEHILSRGEVTLGNVVQAKALASPALTTDATERSIGEAYYSLLLAAFLEKHKGAQIALQEDVGVGVVLHSAAEDDPKGDKIDFAVIRRSLRFDWTKPREMLLGVQELADQACRWLTNEGERRDLLTLIYGIATQIAATIGRENRRCSPEHDESHKPTDRIAIDLEIIRKQLAAAKAQYESDTQRAAQFLYARGMAYGVLGMILLCAALGGVFALTDAKVTGGVAFAAGAVGACLSVLQRMTKGTLDLNAQAGNEMILAFGALRPLVGGVFGAVIYFVIRADLISVFTLPNETQAALAYVAFFGFVAGFNERFFQDMLATASSSRPED